MGCDIHAYWEAKENGQWYFCKQWALVRSYQFFSKMSDGHGRGNEKPISPCKGIPNDVSFVVKKIFDSWDIDFHSHSYLNAHEIELLKNWFKEIGAKEEYFELLNAHEDFIEFLEFEDYRLVFAFDN